METHENHQNNSEQNEKKLARDITREPYFHLVTENPQMSAGTATFISITLWVVAIVIILISLSLDKIYIVAGISIAIPLILLAIQITFIRSIIVLLYQILKATEAIMKKQR